MESVGRKLNSKVIEKSLRLLKILHPIEKSRTTSKTVLHIYSKPPENCFKFKSFCLPLTNHVRFLCTTAVNYTENNDSDEKKTSAKFHDMLANDKELRNMLEDIMHDFNDTPPPNEPPKVKTSVNQKSDTETAGKSKPCESCGSSHTIPHSTEGQFQVFEEAQAEEILDYDEEQQQQEQFYLYQEKEDPLQKYTFKRGKEGVFDIEELVTILNQENAADITVISVPDSLHYCKYLVIVTAKSTRHLRALCEFINKLYKKKKSKGDPFLNVEGRESTNWSVLDMGHIVLHVFLEATRIQYDLESLWTIGEQYDDLSNLKEDPVLDLLQKHIKYLDEIETLPVAEKQ